MVIRAATAQRKKSYAHFLHVLCDDSDGCPSIYTIGIMVRGHEIQLAKWYGVMK